MITLGSTIGHIRVTDLLGSGGMGEVYLGHDEKLRRRVAIKTIRTDRTGDAAHKARFLQEAVILSSLDHPHICRIYDYVEGDETDYLILELVQGTSLGKLIAAGGLSDARKLEVAIQIAEVLTAAHAEGVVHRDLKPDNVMLSADGAVKVLDFGLACLHRTDEPTLVVERSPGGVVAPHPSRATQPLPSVHVETEAGFVVGTPQYMSPEQARGRVATPASDMCSFGLLLQELFTGRPPYDTSSRGEILLAEIAEGKTRPLSGLGKELTELIERCKSMSPRDRPTAREALDRLRWIADTPRRHVRRAVVAVVWVVLLALASVTGVQSWRASRAAERAGREAERASLEARASQEVASFLVNLFAVSDPGEARGNSVTAREILDHGAERIRRELGDQPALQAKLMNTMGTVYVKLGLHAEAEPLLAGAVEIREALGGESTSNDEPDRAPDRNPGVGDDLSEYLFDLGVLYRYMGRLDDAEAYYTRALDGFERTRGPGHADVSRALGALADLYLAEDRNSEALPLLERTLAIEERELGPEHAEVASTLISIGVMHCQQGELAAAEPLFVRAVAIYEKTLGPDHMNLAAVLFNLAGIYREQGRYDEALAKLERARAIEERSLGPDHPSVAFTILGFGELLSAQGRFSEAIVELQMCLGIWERKLGPDHPDLARVLNALGQARAGLGESAAAVPLLERSLAVLDHNDLADHRLAADASFFLAEALRASGRPALAERHYRSAMRVYELTGGATDPALETARSGLAELLHSLGRSGEAVELETSPATAS